MLVNIYEISLFRQYLAFSSKNPGRIYNCASLIFTNVTGIILDDLRRDWDWFAVENRARDLSCVAYGPAQADSVTW